MTFTFNGDQGRQARELIARARGAFGQHRELLHGKPGWDNKMFALRMPVEGTFSRVAGAVYWAKEDLGVLNTLQLHIMRVMFQLRRGNGENRCEWNKRAMWFTRAWLQSHHYERWSTKIRKFQFNLAGHSARQVEDDGRGFQGLPGITSRFLQSRSVKWWREQQKITELLPVLREHGMTGRASRPRLAPKPRPLPPWRLVGSNTVVAPMEREPSSTRRRWTLEDSRQAIRRHRTAGSTRGLFAGQLNTPNLVQNDGGEPGPIATSEFVEVILEEPVNQGDTGGEASEDTWQDWGDEYRPLAQGRVGDEPPEESGEEGREYHAWRDL